MSIRRDKGIVLRTTGGKVAGVIETTRTGERALTRRVNPERHMWRPGAFTVEPGFGFDDEHLQVAFNRGCRRVIVVSEDRRRIWKTLLRTFFERGVKVHFAPYAPQTILELRFWQYVEREPARAAVAS